MNASPLFPESMSLFERASAVIPGGIYGHTTPAATVPGEFPYFASKAKGCRYWDVDGREYIDFLCAYGPMILGHQHPEVEAAAERQRRDGNCMNHPAPAMVELAEKLVGLVDFASWSVFGKNGSDMTTWAIQVAREFTGRKKILRAAGSYHGSHAWCTPGHGGLIEEDRRHIHTFQWNVVGDFQKQVELLKGQVAAAIFTPFHHPLFEESAMPLEGYFPAIKEICKREKILLIIDDIRAGFRLHLGGSHRVLGIEPDMVCFSKALGNGHPISATLGREELKVAASRVFLTGSFWNSAEAMAASLACLNIMERENSVGHIRAMGEMLCEGLKARAGKRGIEIGISGPPSMPFMMFRKEKNLFRSQRFAAECVKRGVFFHPHHNWFLSAAHQPADIEQALAVADEAFAVIEREFGS